MKKKLLGSGWKMNKTLKDAVAYCETLIAGRQKDSKTQIFMVAPFTHLWKLHQLTLDTDILIGAQNMHFADSGAFTGEISPPMLEEIGIDLVELGHSERRSYYGESDVDVNKKALAAIAHHLIPLICIGEQRIEKEYRVTGEVIGKQVKMALRNIPGDVIDRVWLAYEPVWAIGSGGEPADPAYVSEVHAGIRSVLAGLYGRERANDVKILYGGSVNRDNALNFLKQPDVDGLFIGRASWDAAGFLEIIKLSDTLA